MRSLNMHAETATGSDHTSFMFNSQNASDFYNLLDVYLNTVFEPKFDIFNFRNEGWRYEFAQIDNPDSELQLKGNCLQEMTNFHYVPENAFQEAIKRHLFSNTNYQFCPGGTRDQIIKNSYEEVKINIKTI